MMGCSPSAMRVPARPPSVTNRWVSAFPLRFCRGRCWAAGRVGTVERAAPAPARSARTTRSVAKMKIQSRARNPNRRTWTTIGSFMARARRARSCRLLPVDEDGVAQPDDITVLQLPALRPMPVDRGAVGGAEIVQHGARAVEPDVDVPAGHAAVRQSQVGVLAPADHVAARVQLQPLLAAVHGEQVPDPLLLLVGRRRDHCGRLAVAVRGAGVAAALVVRVAVPRLRRAVAGLSVTVAVPALVGLAVAGVAATVPAALVARAGAAAVPA